MKLHRRAEFEIREAATWYSDESVAAGERFLQEVRATFETLEQDPNRFAKLETMAPEDPFRRVLIKGFPYIVVYEVLENEVFVYSVAHASRRPNYWRRRKRQSQ